jgi:3-dehydroquinate dehydratase-2
VSRRRRVEVLHGVNLDQLGRRDPAHYGGIDLAQLDRRVAEFGAELDIAVSFFQTNHEGAYVERLHRLSDVADAAILNPGAWTHYAWSLHDALELAGVPAVEVHLSDVAAREPWRQQSVIAPLCVETISGRGVDGYRDALVALRRVLDD